MDLEFALAGLLAGVLIRMVAYFEVVLADRYSKHISTRIMEHASKLDLTTFEDPLFYDKMERARVQGTDRLVMIQSTGMLIQQLVTTISMAGGIIFLSPWILLVLIACVVPAFMGETHFAFKGYSLNFKQTPAKREMEYLRIVGGSKESAKELKLFGLANYLVGRYSKLSNQLHAENVNLAKRRLLVGTVFTTLSAVGYYGSYAFVIFKTVTGSLDIGTFYFMVGAIALASSNIQSVFTTFSTIADQAMFITDLLDFFNLKPRVFSKPNALRAPRPIRLGFEFQNVSFNYPGQTRQVLSNVSFQSAADGAHRAGWRKRPRQDDDREAADAAVRPDRRTDFAGWRGSARLRPRGSVERDRRHLSGFCALRHDGEREHRDRAD